MKSKFTAEVRKFINDNVVGKTSEELTHLVNQSFDLNLTVKQIQQYKKTHKLKSGIDTRFVKNRIPINKKW